MRLIGIAIVLFVCMLSCVSSVTAATYEEYTEQISELEGQLTTLLAFEITVDRYPELHKIQKELEKLGKKASKKETRGDLTLMQIHDIWKQINTVKKLFPNGYWNWDPISGPEAEPELDACDPCPPIEVNILAMVAPSPVCC